MYSIANKNEIKPINLNLKIEDTSMLPELQKRLILQRKIGSDYLKGFQMSK